MKRNELISLFKGLKLYGMAEAFDETVTKGLQRKQSIQEILGQLEKYDLVILRHVLEYLTDSSLAMKKINQLLKPSGKKLLEFPNIESLEAKIKRVIQIFNKKNISQIINQDIVMNSVKNHFNSCLAKLVLN